MAGLINENKFENIFFLIRFYFRLKKKKLMTKYHLILSLLHEPNSDFAD